MNVEGKATEVPRLTVPGALIVKPGTAAILDVTVIVIAVVAAPYAEAVPTSGTAVMTIRVIIF